MLPGPVIVTKCPNCQGLVLRRTFASANTLGAKWWTDGEFRARMLPMTPGLIRCGHCSQVAWRDAFEEVDSYESYSGFLAFSKEEDAKKRIENAKAKRAQYENLPYFEGPSAEEIIRFVNQSSLLADQEVHARILAWRSWNDSRRDEDKYQALTEEEERNLIRIVELLEKAGDQILLLSEAYRELGDLESARRVIDHSAFADEEQSTVQFLLELIDRGDTQVCLITEDDDREWRMLRRERSRNAPNPSLPAYETSGPPVFSIVSNKWWFKPVGMLVHNWALVEKNTDGTATVYFFHDLGTTKNTPPGYRYYQLKGRCAVVDSLNFEDEELAVLELEFNGFEELSKNPGPWDGCEPFGTFYDARGTEDGVYSRGGYWEKMP
jgi:hypothetical protein